MKNFLFSLSEIGGQTSPESIEIVKPDDDNESESENNEDDLKNLFLTFNSHLNLLILPVYFN